MGYQTMIMSIALGTMILFLTSWQDFSRKAFRHKPWKFVAGLVLFLGLNFFVYLVLLKITLPHWPSIGAKEYEPYQLLQPMLLALLYFGAGSNTYSFSDKLQINFYQSFISICQNLLRIPQTYKRQVINCINKAEEIDSLMNKVKEIRNRVMADGKLEGDSKKWEELNQQVKDMQKRMEDLIDVTDKIENSGLKPEDRLINITKSLQEKISRQQVEELEKLKDYLCDFIFNNVKDIDLLREVLDVFGEVPGSGGQGWFGQNSQIVMRSTVICVIGGLMFCFMKAGTSESAINFGICGAVSLGTFGFIFSFIKLTRWRFQELFIVLFVGVMAGTIGASVWKLLSGALVAVPRDHAVSWRIILFNGAMFGAAIAALLFTFRFHADRVFKKAMFKYLGIAVSGGALFPLLIFLSRSGRGTVDTLLTAPMGAMVLLALSYALDIFNHEGIRNKQAIP